MMGGCSAPQHQCTTAPSGGVQYAESSGMARVLHIGRPSQSDPTGTGMIVNDILTPWRFPETDPFILLHEFGPLQSSRLSIPIGMHPHRGFNEVPYLKEGYWIGTDAWKPDGDPSNPMRSGSLQWGMIGSGIEHGVKFERSYTGNVHGFQLWINLPADQKMDPPCFQDSEPDALPLVQFPDTATAKVLVGEVDGQTSPVRTGRLQVQYVDFMLPPKAEHVHRLPEGYSSVFVYVYEGCGQVVGRPVRRSDVLKIEACGPLTLAADDGSALGALLLAGKPLGESIVQHGPFVMASRQQIQQTFHDYQRGAFLNETCKYILHSANGSIESELKR